MQSISLFCCACVMRYTHRPIICEQGRSHDQSGLRFVSVRARLIGTDFASVDSACCIEPAHAQILMKLTCVCAQKSLQIDLILPSAPAKGITRSLGLSMIRHLHQVTSSQSSPSNAHNQGTYLEISLVVVFIIPLRITIRYMRMRALLPRHYFGDMAYMPDLVMIPVSECRPHAHSRRPPGAYLGAFDMNVRGLGHAILQLTSAALNPLATSARIFCLSIVAFIVNPPNLFDVVASQCTGSIYWSKLHSTKTLFVGSPPCFSGINNLSRHRHVRAQCILTQ